MNDSFKIAFRELTLSDKRNQISNELLLIHGLTKESLKNYGFLTNSKVKNYNSNDNDNFTEDEILTFFYEDIYNIEKDLITLLNIINKK